MNQLSLNFKQVRKGLLLCLLLVNIFALVVPEVSFAQAELDIDTPDYVDDDSDAITAGSEVTLEVLTIIQIILAAIVSLGGIYIIWSSFSEYRDGKLKLGEFLLHSGISLAVMVIAYFVIVFLDDIIDGLGE